jgi:uncharacterized protein (DUF427 family)
VPKAVFNGEVIAESDDTILVGRRHYFPREAVSDDHVRESEETSWCPWKGRARYLDVHAGGKVSRGGAWYYPAQRRRFARIAGRVAFWRGVTVEA